MNSLIYRCGWCGYPTNKEGKFINNHETIKKVSNIIDKYET